MSVAVETEAPEDRSEQPPTTLRRTGEWARRAPLLPALIFTIIVTQLPFVATLVISFMNWNAYYPDERGFAGFANFQWVFTDPQIAMVGMTESEAMAAGFDVVTKVQSYGDTAYGWAMEDTTGVAKLIAERTTGRLLGAHIMGHQASSIIQPVIQAMSFGLSAQEMARGQYWIHPALPEVIENALLGLAV